MRPQYIFISLLLFPLLWLGCATTKQSTPNDGHTSQNSLDWTGIYSGVLPCADCEGISTMIELRQDNTYQLTQKYPGKDESVTTSTGAFSWTENGGEIVLKEKSAPFHFKVGENRLFLLDGYGERVSGPLKDNYILNKDMNGITEKYWKLVQLKGEPVKVVGLHEPYIILKRNGAHFKGNGGCNDIGGDYDLGQGNVIRFRSISSTEMACEALLKEQQFLKVLKGVDNFLLNGDTLFLQNNRKTVAIFEVVYLR